MKIIPFVDSEMTAVIDNLDLFWGGFAFRYFEWYTHFYRIREEGGSGHTPPHQSFENRWRNIGILTLF